MTLRRRFYDYDTKAMPDEKTRKLFRLLHEHRGKSAAISMLDLYEQWIGERLPRDEHGRPEADVPTLSRYMRQLIDDLRDTHGVPVMSSSHAGYWIVESEAELADVCREFRARGLKSLATAAKLKKISLAEELQQAELDLRIQP